MNALNPFLFALLSLFLFLHGIPLAQAVSPHRTDGRSHNDWQAIAKQNQAHQNRVASSGRRDSLGRDSSFLLDEPTGLGVCRSRPMEWWFCVQMMSKTSNRSFAPMLQLVPYDCA